MNRLLTIVLLGLAAALVGAIVTVIPRATNAQEPAACDCTADDEASCADCEHCAGEGCEQCAAGCEQCAGEGCEQCADGCECAEGECECAEGACECGDGACEHGAGATHGAAHSEPSVRIAA